MFGKTSGDEGAASEADMFTNYSPAKFPSVCFVRRDRKRRSLRLVLPSSGFGGSMLQKLKGQTV